MKTDLDIQQNVIDELQWDPLLNAAEIGVSVKNGVVTLSGQVDSYAKKLAAEKAATKIAGVKAVAEDIQVGISPIFRKTDTEIAEAVLRALSWHTSVPEGKIRIKVEDGVITMEGELDWAYQREAAKKAVENLAGVRMVHNFTTIKPVVTSENIKQKISAAFHRSATIDADRIRAEVTGSKVILQGKVRSFAELEDAKNAALSAPGVISVENNLEIETIDEPEFIE